MAPQERHTLATLATRRHNRRAQVYNARMTLITLGGLELRGVHFTQPKPLLLLAYLALEGPQARAHLAELFWPEGESRKSLSMALTRLRQAAGSVIEADEKRVWTALESDATALLAALGRSDWTAADTRYTGAFLQGVTLEWGAELEEWVYTTREYLAERVQHALLELAERAARARDFAETLRLAERTYRLPGAAPADVGMLERLYHLLVASESVLAPRARKELEDYGLKPALHPEAARAAFRPAPQTLPLRPTSFVGRELEQLELGDILERCQLLTLLGSGGIGKTRLALQFAAEQQRSDLYPDGLYFVALETESESTLLSALARVLGCALTSPAAAQEELGAFLETKRLLVILDNAEHLSAAAPLLSPLLRRAPGLKLLVTSRVRLELAEEYLFPLSGLGFPKRPVAAEEAISFGAVQLFAQRAQQLCPTFAAEEELSAVLELCALLDGSPLGLELAAGWVRFMPVSDIVRELQQSLDFLTSRSRDVPERQRSLRAAFESSWRLLHPDEQAALAALSVFAGGFTREAASEVTGAKIPLLASLLDKSLLRLPFGSRFELHPLVAHYAGEKLRETPGRVQESRARHARYFISLAGAQDAAVQAGRQGDALRVLEAEWANIRAGFEYSLEHHDFAELERGLELLEMLHDTRGSSSEALEFLARAETLLAAQDVPDLLGGVRSKRAWFELRLGHYERARASVLSALTTLSETSYWRVSALNILSILERRSGNYAQARAACEAGLALARGQHELEAAKLLASLADIEEVLGAHAASETHFLEAIALYRKHDRVLGVVRNLNNLGWLYYVTHRLREARAVFEEGLRLARDIGFRQTLPYLLNNLGYIALADGRFEEALRLNVEALELAQANGERAVQAEILTSLARTTAALGRYEEAARYLKDGLELAWDVAYIGLVLQALLTKGELLEHAGDVFGAAKLAFFVGVQPAATVVETDQAAALLKKLGARLSPEKLAQAETFGQNAELSQVVESSLRQHAEAKEAPEPHPQTD